MRPCVIPDLQSAYRAQPSTETAVLKIVSDILWTADSGKVTLRGLLDMSAAFHTVDHSILIDRLNTRLAPVAQFCPGPSLL